MKLWLINIASKTLQYVSDSETITDGYTETLNGSPVAVYRQVPDGFEPGNVVVVDDGLNAGASSLTLAGDNNAKSSPLWSDMRAQRNALLSSTDWTQAADVQAGTAVLSAQEKTDYATYRQALRDLPGNTANPEAVTWPEVP